MASHTRKRKIDGRWRNVEKIRYEGEFAALKAVDRMVAQGRPGSFQVYQCPECPHWHVGHPKRPPLPRWFPKPDPNPAKARYNLLRVLHRQINQYRLLQMREHHG